MAVSCGWNCTFVVAEQGQVLVSGCGQHGQLALGDTQDRLRMTRLAGDFTMRVVMVSTGWGHSALQDSDGELWMCGRGSSGQLGTGGREDMLTPTRVPKWRLGRARVKMAACGIDHTLVLTEASRVWAFGSGEDGRLGTGDEDDRTTPTEVAGLQGVTITFVAAGCGHSVALSAGGGTFSWGCGYGGKLGHGNTDKQLEPRQVEAVDGRHAKELRAAGFTAHELRDAGFLARELRPAKFDVALLRTVGYAAADMREASITSPASSGVSALSTCGLPPVGCSSMRTEPALG